MTDVWDYQEKRLSKATYLLSKSHFHFKKIMAPEIDGLPSYKERAAEMIKKIESFLLG